MRCLWYDNIVHFDANEIRFLFQYCFTTCFPDYGLRETENNAYAKFWVMNKEHYGDGISGQLY